MPIKIPDALPATAILESENIFVMTEYRAMHQSIRPLKLLILNLMPTKIATETQLLRRLSNTPLQVEAEFLQLASRQAENASAGHMGDFYRTFDQVKDNYYDGLIITGTPADEKSFEQVDYWDELCEVMNWSRKHVHCTMHVGWGAMAALYYHYGIHSQNLDDRVWGVYRHEVIKKTSPFFRGFDEYFFAPHSRHPKIAREDIEAIPELEVMAASEETGVFAAKTISSRQFFILGHPEYDEDTLANEYFKASEDGRPSAVPENYFEDDDPSKNPVVRWKSAAQLMYSNWLNYYVYQTTPYDINTIREAPAGEKTE